MTASASPVFDWNAPLGLPEFGKIADADFAPAFEIALAEHDAEIDAIAGNPEAPDFDNTSLLWSLRATSCRGSPRCSGTGPEPTPMM
jgi:Zn-dependent oligopeptidase